jgi:AraC family transcriptional regulator, transcriptional activator of the genes for pyochelin and ferripyochelin receptors
MECLQAAKRLIEKDLSAHYTIQEIATHINLSDTKLKKGFKKAFGFNIFEYLEMQRLEKAKEMIEHEEKSLKQISSAVGFKYTNNFSIAFKKRYGISPGSWRKSLHSFFIVADYVFKLLLKLSSISVI